MTNQKTIAQILVFALLSNWCATAQLSYEYSGQTHLWGPIQLLDLESGPYKSWFTKGKTNYQPEINKDLFAEFKDVTVKIFLGTWCGDTKYYLPQFVKIWELAGLNHAQLNLIALHNESDRYKQAPDGIEKTYGIHRVPTFIFEREGKEIGRIVEQPVTSLPIDMAQISAALPSAPSYQAVAALQNYFKTVEVDSLYQQYDQIESRVLRNVSTVSELTTYAKKLHKEGEVDQAEFVYKVAKEAFPFHPYPYYSLGKFHFECENWEDSKTHFVACQDKKLGYFDSFEYLSKLEEKLKADDIVK